MLGAGTVARSGTFTSAFTLYLNPSFSASARHLSILFIPPGLGTGDTPPYLNTRDWICCLDHGYAKLYRRPWSQNPFPYPISHYPIQRRPHELLRIPGSMKYWSKYLPLLLRDNRKLSSLFCKGSTADVICCDGNGLLSRSSVIEQVNITTYPFSILPY